MPIGIEQRLQGSEPRQMPSSGALHTIDNPHISLPETPALHNGAVFDQQIVSTFLTYVNSEQGLEQERTIYMSIQQTGTPVSSVRISS